MYKENVLYDFINRILLTSVATFLSSRAAAPHQLNSAQLLLSPCIFWFVNVKNNKKGIKTVFPLFICVIVDGLHRFGRIQRPLIFVGSMLS